MYGTRSSSINPSFQYDDIVILRTKKIYIINKHNVVLLNVGMNEK